MARTKLKVKSRDGRSASASVRTAGAEKTEVVTVQDYGMITLVFTGFCLVQWFIVRTILKDHAGINFFFGFVVVAFVVVSVFDYLARRLRLGEAVDES